MELNKTVHESSLTGFWKLRRNGSDLSTNLAGIIGAPWSTLLAMEHCDTEFISVHQKQLGNKEEIVLIFQSPATAKYVSMLHHVRYTIGTLNFGEWKGNNLFRIVAGIDESFKYLRLLQLGPNITQRCVETFKLDKNGQEIKVISEFDYKGVTCFQIRYLDRFVPSSGIHAPKSLLFSRAISSRGWECKELVEFSTICNIVISLDSVKTLDSKISTADVSSIQANCIEEIMDRYRQGQANRRSLPVYLIKVSHNETHWIVGHRYNEFKAFYYYVNAIISNEKISIPKGHPIPPFPGKSFISSDIDRRKLAFEKYIAYFIFVGALGSQNILTLLLGFLEIPSNIYTNCDSQLSTSQNILPLPTEGKTPAQPASSLYSIIRSSNNVPAQPTSKPTTIAPGPAPAASAVIKPEIFSKKASKANKTFFSSLSRPHLPATEEESSETESGRGNKPVATAQSALANAVSATHTVRSNVAVGASKDPVAVINEQAPATGPSLPLSTSTDNSYSYTRRPQDILFESLQVGILVLKHGRQGYPKKRLLRCNASLTRLYWDNPPAFGTQFRKPGFVADLPPESKSIAVADVKTIRKGTEVDVNARSAMTSRSNVALLGTEILRRNCKSNELELCFSLILDTRTLDIQCLNKSDFDLLFSNIKGLLDARK